MAVVITRNVALFTQLSPELRNFVYQAINRDIVSNGGTAFYDEQTFIHSAAASTLLEDSAEFKTALNWTRNALETAANAYRGADTREYADGYISHLLDGNVIPQALNITIGMAVNIRMRIDTAMAKVKPARVKKQRKVKK